jgi:hypothetical protein
MGTNQPNIECIHVTTVDIDRQRYDVAVEIEHDGVEYRGRLRFTDEAWADDEGVADFGMLPGRRVDEVVAYAQSLSDEDLVQRYRRAVAEKRRFHGMRRMTEEVLNGIRHLNHVATSMRAGLLGIEEAAAEIDATEHHLHELVARLRHVAGVET